jgi:hypothetical protein
MPPVRWARAAAAGALLVLGCRGDGPAAPDTTPATLVVSAPAATLRAGETVQLTAVARNAAGDVVPARAVAYTTSAPDVLTVSPAGLASAAGPAGAATVTAAIGAVAAAPLTLTVTAAAPARVAKLGADPATVPTETSFGDSIRVEVSDQFGNPVGGVAVAFAATAGGGAVSPATATTDAGGRAAARFVVGTTAGAPHTATATVAGLPAVSFSTTAVPRQRALQAVTYRGAPAQPAAVLTNGEHVTVSYWTSTGAPGGALVQGAYVDTRRGIDTRVVFADGLPARIYDTRSGEQIVVVQRENRVDYLLYGANGQYTGGVAVLLAQDKLYTARVLSRPAFSGQLAAVSDRVSFAVTGRPQSGLGPLAEAPGAFSAFFAANVGAAVPAAAPLAYGRAGRSAAAAPSTTAQLRRALTVAGLALAAPAAAALIGGTAVTTATVGMAAAGLGIVGIANLPNLQLDAWDQFDRAVAQFFQDGASLDRSPSETAQTLAQDLVGLGRGTARGLGNLVSRAGDAARDALTSFASPGGFTAAAGGPPADAAAVDGYGVDAANTLYPLTGTVSGTGDLSVASTGPAGGPSLSVTGAVTGTTFTGRYSGTAGAGPIGGAVAQLGSCQSQTASGGQGTFARAFNMGAAAGSVSFAYDAYSIPDAFRVVTGGAAVFATNGLVSGRSATSFPLRGSSIVFVTVTAPRSGTAWEFALGCPQ